MRNHDPVPTEPDDDDVPFGLPVLAELPGLAAALDALCQADRAIASAIRLLLPLVDTGEVEATAGVDVAHFLRLVARRTGTDARMLTATVRTCRRLPSLWHAFSAGRLSWAQTRALVLRLQRPIPLDDTELDGVVARAIDDAAGADPDAVATRLGWALDALEPEPPASEVAADDDGFLHLQPRLDGTGGRVYGNLGPVPFALLDTTTAPTPLTVGRSTDPVGTDPGRLRRGRRRRRRRRCRSDAGAGEARCADRHPVGPPSPRPAVRRLRRGRAPRRGRRGRRPPCGCRLGRDGLGARRPRCERGWGEAAAAGRARHPARPRHPSRPAADHPGRRGDAGRPRDRPPAC